jgi:hypothetical protein
VKYFLPTNLKEVVNLTMETIDKGIFQRAAIACNSLSLSVITSQEVTKAQSFQIHKQPVGATRLERIRGVEYTSMTWANV